MTREGFDRFAHRGKELIYYEEGVTATVMVARNPGTLDNIYLSVDGKVDASSHGDIETQLLSAHVPMLLAQETKDVLVIGYASGMTVGAATLYDIDSLASVEIEPAVVRASRAFTPYNHDPLSNPKVEVIMGDGRNFLLVTDRMFDVIISEPSNPWMTIASNLFTHEFFEIGRKRLKPGGIFCGWVQLYGLPPDLLRAMVRTFSEVYPHVSVWMPIPFADLILLGSDEPFAPDLERMRARMGAAAVGADLARINVATPADLLSYQVLGDREARAFAGSGEINSDDNALIEFQAPLALYAGTRVPNAKAIVPHLSDPLEGVRGMGDDPPSRAAVYDALGEAFFRREIAGRAFNAFNAAHALDPTEERTRRIDEVQEWFRQELMRRQAEALEAGG
jgi:spermidine synthase